MIKIAIVEDDKSDQQILNNYLLRFQEENREALSISICNDGLDFLEFASDTFDIVLMDIEMPFMNGLSVAKKFRAIDKNAILIFVTNMHQYAINGYEVDAMGFMVKPISYYALSILIKKAIQRIAAFSQAEISIIANNKYRRIRINDIYYVEVDRYQVTYHLKNGKETINERFYNVDKQLKDYPFVQCNQCYLVNLQHVTKLDGEIVVCGGYELKISRRRKQEFEKKLAEFMGGSNYKWNS